MDEVLLGDVSPSRAGFGELVESNRLIPISTSLIADTLTPVRVLRSVVGESDGFLLESVEGGERWGRYSFVGRNPLATIVSKGGVVSVNSPQLDIPTGDKILDVLESLLEQVTTLIIFYMYNIYFCNSGTTV